MVSVFQFIMKQSYICALIAMMVCTRGHSAGAGKCTHGPLAGSLAVFSGTAERSSSPHYFGGECLVILIFHGIFILWILKSYPLPLSLLLNINTFLPN